jgi:hypothetical protein
MCRTLMSETQRSQGLHFSETAPSSLAYRARPTWRPTRPATPQKRLRRFDCRSNPLIGLPTRLRHIVTRGMHGILWPLRWITLLFRVALRCLWRIHGVVFRCTLNGYADHDASVQQVLELYDDYHRAVMYLLLGNLNAAQLDPPPPLPPSPER